MTIFLRYSIYFTWYLGIRKIWSPSYFCWFSFQQFWVWNPKPSEITWKTLFQIKLHYTNTFLSEKNWPHFIPKVMDQLKVVISNTDSMNLLMMTQNQWLKSQWVNLNNQKPHLLIQILARRRKDHQSQEAEVWHRWEFLDFFLGLIVVRFWYQDYPVKLIGNFLEFWWKNMMETKFFWLVHHFEQFFGSKISSKINW